VQVAAAEPDRGHPHHHLTGARLLDLDLGDLQRLARGMEESRAGLHSHAPWKKRVGWPDTPGLAAKIAPAWGSARRAAAFMPQLALVMNRSLQSSPPKAQLVT
jgi:hypothetical protein